METILITPGEIRHLSNLMHMRSPATGQVLVAEMQDLGSLVESSYTAVMMAQTAFIDSCKRIQEEEPLLERKMTELLDKLVTNIDLG